MGSFDIYLRHLYCELDKIWWSQYELKTPEKSPKKVLKLHFGIFLDTLYIFMMAKMSFSYRRMLKYPLDVSYFVCISPSYDFSIVFCHNCEGSCWDLRLMWLHTTYWKFSHFGRFYFYSGIYSIVFVILETFSTVQINVCMIFRISDNVTRSFYNVLTMILP